jgi:hypothetical protein
MKGNFSDQRILSSNLKTAPTVGWSIDQVETKLAGQVLQGLGSTYEMKPR